MAGGQGQCSGCGARPGEKCDPNGHMAAPAAEARDEHSGMEWAHNEPGFPAVVVLPDEDGMVRMTLAEIDGFLRGIGYRSRRSVPPALRPEWEPKPPTLGECVEHARSSLMAAEALLVQGGGAAADVHANVAAGWGTLAMVLGSPEAPPSPRRMRHFGGES